MSGQLSSGNELLQRRQHSRVPRLVTARPMTSGSVSSFSTLQTSTSSIPSIATFGHKSQLDFGFLQHPSSPPTSAADIACVSHPLQSQTFCTTSRQIFPHLSTIAPSFQSHHPQPHSDLPQGPQLPNLELPSTSTSIVLPHSQPPQALQHDELDDNDDVNNPGEDFLEHIPDKPMKGLRGIGQGKAEPKEQRVERKFLSCELHGGFSDKYAKKTVSNLIRKNFNTRYTKWDEVPKFRKDRIWNQFEMRFQWDLEDNEAISRKFDKHVKRCYSTCLNQAKKKWEKGSRVKWLTHKQMKRLVRYWKKPEVEAKADRMRSNRGVRKDEHGRNMPAPKTYKGGSVSMYDRDREQTKLKGRQFNELCLETFVRTHVDPIPNIPEGELYTGRSDLVWVDDAIRQRHVRYMDNLIEKYRENHDQMPTPLDPINSAVWQQAVGGVKSGRVPGLSYEIRPETLGFNTKSHPPPFVPPQSQHVEVCQLREQIEQQQRNFDEKIEAMARQIKVLLQSRSQDHSPSSHKSYEAEQQPHSAIGSDGHNLERQGQSHEQGVARDIGEDFMELLRCDGGLT